MDLAGEAVGYIHEGDIGCVEGVRCSLAEQGLIACLPERAEGPRVAGKDMSSGYTHHLLADLHRKDFSPGQGIDDVRTHGFHVVKAENLDYSYMETYSIAHVVTVYHCLLLSALEYTEEIKEEPSTDKSPRPGMVSTGGQNEMQPLWASLKRDPLTSAP